MSTSLSRLAPLLAGLLLATGASAALELKSWLGSAYIVPGEETELWISVLSDTRPDGNPTAARTPNVAVRPLEYSVFPRTTREKLYVYPFQVVKFYMVFKM